MNPARSVWSANHKSCSFGCSETRTFETARNLSDCLAAKAVRETETAKSVSTLTITPLLLSVQVSTEKHESFALTESLELRHLHKFAGLNCFLASIPVVHTRASFPQKQSRTRCLASHFPSKKRPIVDLQVRRRDVRGRDARSARLAVVQRAPDTLCFKTNLILFLGFISSCTQSTFCSTDKSASPQPPCSLTSGLCHAFM